MTHLKVTRYSCQILTTLGFSQILTTLEFSQILTTLEFSRHILEKFHIFSFTKIHAWGVKTFHEDRQTDDFRSSANAPKIHTCSRLCFPCHVCRYLDESTGIGHDTQL